jgi:hypothetical protein
MRGLALLCLSLIGCAAPGSLGYGSAMGGGGASSSCEVVAGDWIADERVTVSGGWAISDTLLGDRHIARIAEDGSIYVEGLFGSSHRGAFKDGRLVVSGLLSDAVSEPIEGGEVKFPGLVFNTAYRYSAGCSAREAAVGAMALRILAEEQQSKNGQPGGQ